MHDKFKQYVAFVGGALGGVLLFLKSINVEITHFNDTSIQAFVGMLTSFIPLILVGYGIWKNQYIVTDKARKQEDELKRKGLK